MFGKMEYSLVSHLEQTCEACALKDISFSYFKGRVEAADVASKQSAGRVVLLTWLKLGEKDLFGSFAAR